MTFFQFPPKVSFFLSQKKKKKWVSFFAHCAVGLEDEFQFDEAKAGDHFLRIL